MGKKRAHELIDNLVNVQNDKKDQKLGQQAKKPRITINNYVTRLDNVFSSEELETLITDARKHEISEEPKHGDDSSKRFCFNALVSCSKSNHITLKDVEKLFGGPTWEELDIQVRQTVIKGIRIAINQSQKEVKQVSHLVHARPSHNKISHFITDTDQNLVCFELIHIPFQGIKSIPGLIWHSDEGYHIKTQEPFCYADSTSVFMLSDPIAWRGGNIQLRKDKKMLGTYKYEHNGAITFINKGTEHRVTRIRPYSQDSARIVLIVSVYSQEETSEYMSKLSIDSIRF